MGVIDWIAPSLGNPVVYSFVSIADKTVLSRFGLGLPSFNFFVGISQLLISAVIFAVPASRDPDVGAVLAGLGAGALHGTSLVVMFWVLKREEVTRVVPIAQTSPIFVALIAVVALDESLGPLQWLAVLLAVAGAVLVSVRRSGDGGGIQVRSALAFLALSALLVAGSQLLLKVGTDDLPVWDVVALRGIGLGAVMCLPFARPAALVELGRFLTRPRRGMFLVVAEMLLPLAGNVLLISAIARGPVSLVSALVGTRPIFVFATSTLGARFAPALVVEEAGPAELGLKLTSALLVVAAVVLIALG